MVFEAFSLAGSLSTLRYAVGERNAARCDYLPGGISAGTTAGVRTSRFVEVSSMNWRSFSILSLNKDAATARPPICAEEAKPGGPTTSPTANTLGLDVRNDLSTSNRKKGTDRQQRERKTIKNHHHSVSPLFISRPPPPLPSSPRHESDGSF